MSIFCRPLVKYPSSENNFFFEQLKMLNINVQLYKIADGGYFFAESSLSLYVIEL